MFDHCVDITEELVVIFELYHAWFRYRANVTQIQYPARWGRFRVLVFVYILFDFNIWKFFHNF